MMQRNARFTLIVLALVCTLPVVASYMFYFFWTPDSTVNYGELLEPTPLPEGGASGVGSEPDLHREDFNGLWTLVYAGPGECDESCRETLYALNQSWKAQGEERRRMQRVWLVSDGVAPTVSGLEDMDTFRRVRAPESWLALFPEHEAGDRIYLVDPLGNVMMRYPSKPEIREVITDLERLLKYSGLGR